MKGFVPTPAYVVDAMVAKLFRVRPPRAEDSLLDPGCGTGAFIHGVMRWCKAMSQPMPRVVGIESDVRLLNEAQQSLADVPEVTLLAEDFLSARCEQFDYVIGNPPYVPITGLSTEERATYRKRYLTARGRFDLYLLFFDQSLRLLKPEGRLVFITPEKFLYVQTAALLRKELATLSVEEIQLVDESTFDGLVTYPTITTVAREPRGVDTRIQLRDGTIRTVRLAADGSSWLPGINGSPDHYGGPTARDAFLRISCGVATGADEVYVLHDTDIPEPLRTFAYRTISGRDIRRDASLCTTHSMLIPYDVSGELLPEEQLGTLGDYLRDPNRQQRLMQRTCVIRKPWYAFHENPPLGDILRPKILCKDIGVRPFFVVDEVGDIVPRHSVYYLVPRDPSSVHEFCGYLNSDAAIEWLVANCQHAANGFVRLQSHVLKRLPVPEGMLRNPQLVCV